MLHVDRAYGVNDVLSRQASARGDHGLASRQSIGVSRTPDLSTFLDDLRPSCAVYRSVDPTPAQESRVRSIDDGVDTFGRQVTHLYDDSSLEKCGYHISILFKLRALNESSDRHEAIVGRNN